jgi:hypothetical protein
MDLKVIIFVLGLLHSQGRFELATDRDQPENNVDHVIIFVLGL